MFLISLGNLLVIAFVSYLGAKLHRPRVIALGCAVMALGCFLSGLPHFLMGRWVPVVTMFPLPANVLLQKPWARVFNSSSTKTEQSLLLTPCVLELLLQNKWPERIQIKFAEGINEVSTMNQQHIVAKSALKRWIFCICEHTIHNSQLCQWILGDEMACLSGMTTFLEEFINLNS